jgi:ribosome-binding protein aMBF1 (putative translation factor)
VPWSHRAQSGGTTRRSCLPILIPVTITRRQFSDKRVHLWFNWDMDVTNIRLRRMAAGLSQKDQAERVGVSLPIYAAIERGQLKPSPRVADLLEQAFDDRLETLLSPIRPRTGRARVPA